VSPVYLCRVASGEVRGGDDASDARWFSELTGVELAFDHAKVLADAFFRLTPPGS